MSERTYEIRDPIHGLLAFNDLERTIINSAAFQRLRRIKQLALTDYIYPGAAHSRFEHSIGVMHVAGRMFDALSGDRRSSDIISAHYGVKREDFPRQRQILRLAALTHDLGHGPFSHAAETLFPKESSSSSKRVPHEEYSSAIIKAEVADVINSHKSANELGIDATEVASYIYGTPKDRTVALFKEIISGTIDADRMDYLLRDSYHCGVSYGKFDLERLINTLGICQDLDEDEEFQVGINRDGIHAAEGLVIARFMMFTQVYMHKTRSIYDYHLEKFFEEILKDAGGTFPDGRSNDGRKAFLDWDDWRVLGELSRGNGGLHGEIIRKRDHFRLIYETNETYENTVEQERAEKLFNKMHKKTSNLGTVRLTTEKSWYKQGLGAEILVRPSQGIGFKGTQLSLASSVVKSLKPVNQLRLYAPMENYDSARSIVDSMC